MRPIIGAFCLFAGMDVLAIYAANTANYAWLAAFVVIVLLAVVTWKWEYFNGSIQEEIRLATLEKLGFPHTRCAHKHLRTLEDGAFIRYVRCDDCGHTVVDNRVLSSN